MLIVKTGEGELTARSASSAAEFGSTLAAASMGVFQGLVALKGRHAVPDGGGVGFVGGGVDGGGSVIVLPLQEICTASFLYVPVHGSPNVALSAMIEQEDLPTQAADTAPVAPA